MATFPNIGRFVSLDQILHFCDLAQRHELAGTQPVFTQTEDQLLYTAVIGGFRQTYPRFEYQMYLGTLGTILDTYRGKTVNEILAIMYSGIDGYPKATLIDCRLLDHLIKYYVEIPATTFVYFLKTNFNFYVSNGLVNTKYFAHLLARHDGVIYCQETKYNLVSLVLVTGKTVLINRLVHTNNVENAADQEDFSGRIPIECIPSKFDNQLIRKLLTPRWSPQYQYCYPQHQALITTVMTINHIPNNVLHLLPRELVYIILRFTLV